MEDNKLKEVLDLIQNGEMIPLYLIKEIISYKFKLGKENDELIKHYRINDDISYNYLKNFKGQYFNKLYMG